jgi:hypothetical protein
MLVPILQYPDRIGPRRLPCVSARRTAKPPAVVRLSRVHADIWRAVRDDAARSFDALDHWARGISLVYLEGAIERARALQPEARLERQLADIERLEFGAALEAEELERAAAICPRRGRARGRETRRHRTRASGGSNRNSRG